MSAAAIASTCCFRFRQSCSRCAEQLVGLVAGQPLVLECDRRGDLGREQLGEPPHAAGLIVRRPSSRRGRPITTAPSPSSSRLQRPHFSASRCAAAPTFASLVICFHGDARSPVASDSASPMRRSP